MLTMLALAAAVSVTQDTVAWTAYLGNQTNPAVWARTVRGPSQLPRFSFDSVIAATRRLPRSQTVIVNVGGLGSALVPEEASAFLQQINADRGTSWRDTVFARADSILAAAGDPDRVVWQVGNEINSRAYDRNVRLWRAGPDRRGAIANSSNLIPVYVEQYLAPTVDALRAWSSARLGHPDKVRIILGTIANSANPMSLAWLDRLLAYRVAGTMATSLRGETVADLVDIVSLHYLVTNGASNWSALLDEQWSRHVGQGRVRAIWATEELGMQRASAGMGAATAVRVTSRWLTWAQARNFGPDKVRWSLWGAGGGPPGTQGRDGMELLFRLFGDAPVRATPQSAPDDQEWYLLEGAGARVLTAFGTRPMGTTVVGRVSLPVRSGETVTAYVIDASGISTVPAVVQLSGGNATVILRPARVLERQAVVMVVASPGS